MTSPALASFLRSHRRSLDTFTLSATRRDCVYLYRMVWLSCPWSLVGPCLT